MGSGISEEVPQHGFILETAAKRKEFICTSQLQADQWIAAIYTAIGKCTNGEVDSEKSTLEGASSMSSSETSEEEELFGVEDDTNLPSLNVPASTMGQPGRCFTASSYLVADKDAASNDTSFSVPSRH